MELVAEHFLSRSPKGYPSKISTRIIDAVYNGVLFIGRQRPEERGLHPRNL